MADILQWTETCYWIVFLSVLIILVKNPTKLYLSKPSKSVYFDTSYQELNVNRWTEIQLKDLYKHLNACFGFISIPEQPFDIILHELRDTLYKYVSLVFIALVIAAMACHLL